MMAFHAKPASTYIALPALDQLNACLVAWYIVYIVRAGRKHSTRVDWLS